MTSPAPPFSSRSLAVTLKILFPVLTIFPPITFPEKLPHRVVRVHLPSKMEGLEVLSWVVLNGNPKEPRRSQIANPTVAGPGKDSGFAQ